MLTLSDEQRTKLAELAASRTAPMCEMERAGVPLKYAQCTSISEIQRLLDVSRSMIYKCIDKALAASVQAGLKDAYHRPHAPEITEETKAWVVSVACAKPKGLGLAAELWSISALARHIAKHAEAMGFPRLAGAVKSMVWGILDENQLKPHKIAYCLEKRPPRFDLKLREVLMVYRDVSLYRQGAGRPKSIYTVSVDEKPGVQAIGLTAPDLPPVPGTAPTVSRDYEYVHHDTVSILAAIDLHAGQIFDQVEDRLRSCEFIALLRSIDD
jgi:transposase